MTLDRNQKNRTTSIFDLQGYEGPGRDIGATSIFDLPAFGGPSTFEPVQPIGKGDFIGKPTIGPGVEPDSIDKVLGIPNVTDTDPFGTPKHHPFYVPDEPEIRDIGPVSFRQGEDPSFVSSLWDKFTGLFTSRAEIAAEAIADVVRAEELGVQPSQLNPDFKTVLRAGKGASLPGLISKVKGGAEYPELPIEELGDFDRTVLKARAFAGDLPFYIAGGLLGTPGGPLTIMGAAFAFPAGLRAMYSRMLDEDPIDTPRKFFETAGNVALETLKGYGTGVVTAEMGGRAAPFGQAAELATEVATFTTVGAGMDGRLPTKQDFMDNAIIILGLKATMRPGRTIANAGAVAKNLQTTWADTAMTPEGVVKGVMEGKLPAEIIDEIASEKGLAPDLTDQVKAKVKEMEVQQAKLLAEYEAKKAKIDPTEAIKAEQEIKTGKVKKTRLVSQKELIRQAMEEPGTPEELIEHTVEMAKELGVPLDEVKRMIEETITERGEEFRTPGDAAMAGVAEELRARKSEINLPKEPIIDVDEQVGAKRPEVLENPETHPLRETKLEETDGMKTIFEKNPEALRTAEGFSRYLINEVNHHLNGGKVPVEKALNALEKLATETNQAREEFINNTKFEDWADMIREASKWAKEAVRLNFERSDTGIQLNMMIPVDQIPKHVRELLNFWEKELGYFKGLKTPEERRDKVYRNEELFGATGFWLDRGGQWRYELSDKELTVKPEALRITGKSYLLEDAIDHPTLFRAVPELSKTKIVRNEYINGGEYSSSNDLITIDSPNNIESLIHELQHATDFKMESKFIGTNVKYIESQKIYGMLMQMREGAKSINVIQEIGNLAREITNTKKLPKDIADYTQRLQAIAKREGEAGNIFQSLFDYYKTGSYKEYLKNPGEINARLATARRNMTTQEQRAEFPWITLDRLLEQEGLSKDTGTTLYSGIDPSLLGKEIIDAGKKFKQAMEKSRGMKKFKPKEAAARVRAEFNRAFIDRAGNIRLDLLDSLGDEGYRVLQKQVNAKGGSSRAADKLKQMSKETYAGLSRKEKAVLDDVIMADRMIDIGQYKTSKEFKFPQGFDPVSSIVYRELFQQYENLTNKQAEKIDQKAKAYFDWMKKPLSDMLKAGLISEQEFDNLSSHNYRKIKLVDIYDRRTERKVGAKKRTVYDSGVESLARGKDTDIFEPSSEVMALEVFNRAYGRIANNEANMSLLKLAREQKENPFVRVKESKADKIPSGWQRIFAFEDGQRKAIYLSPDMAQEWISSNVEMSYKMSQVIRYASLSPILRTMATGVNWGFAVANLPRDIMHALFTARVYENGKWRKVYSPTIPIFAAQMARDQAAVFSDAVNRTGRYTDYIDQNGGMEFLVHQGRLFQRGRHVRGPLDPLQDFFGYFGETSEIMTRLAIRERVIRRRAREQGLSMEEASKNPDITTEATFAARDYMDFGQGGGIAKAFDNGIPYLNAAIQGSRGMFRAFRDNPISSTYTLAQFGGAVVGLYIASVKLNPKTMESLKDDVNKENNIILPFGDKFGFVDEKGQMRYPYAKIPIDPSQRFFKTFFEASTDKWLGNEVDAMKVAASLKGFSPVDIGSLPPSVSALVGYSANKDFWQNEDIWRKTEPFSYPQSKEEFIPGKTSEAFIDLGQLTGLSPERTQHAVEQLLTRGTMWSFLVGQGYDALFSDLPDSQRQKHLAEVLSKVPVSKRFIGVTNPYSKFAEDVDVVREEDTIKRFKENMGLDTKVDGYLYEKNVTKKEIDKYITNFKDIDTQDRLFERFDFSVAIKDLPNRSFWLAIRGITSAEARAGLYVKELNKLSEEGRKELEKGMTIIEAAGGIISDDFLDEVIRLRSR